MSVTARAVRSVQQASSLSIMFVFLEPQKTAVISASVATMEGALTA